MEWLSSLLAKQLTVQWYAGNYIFPKQLKVAVTQTGGRIRQTVCPSHSGSTCASGGRRDFKRLCHKRKMGSVLHGGLCVGADRGNGCIREEIFTSPDGASMYHMPTFPRPSAEKTAASLAANCGAADCTRHFPAFHSRPSAHSFSMPLGKSERQTMTPQEAVCF